MLLFWSNSISEIVALIPEGTVHVANLIFLNRKKTREETSGFTKMGSVSKG